jgi:glycosyltransferase involved in cell wall biosynthesis
MAEPSLVSIIVNNHNYGRFVGQAIDSALNQHGLVPEVVVVDDGSTDDSRAVIDSFSDRVTAVLKENGGQGSAFNAGFAASMGAVVNFLDADDLLHPDTAARAAAALAADAGRVQWLAPLELIDADGNPLGAIVPAAALPAGDLARRVLEYGPWAFPAVPTTGNFWSRRFLERVLPMPEADFRTGGDAYLASIAPLYGGVCSSPLPAGSYRYHGANAYWRDRLSIDDVADDSFNFERIAALLIEHAGRRGLAVQPEKWPARDWRQQLRRLALNRAGRMSQGPLPLALLRAALSDQTRPLKKAVLAPLMVLLPALPRGAAVAMALKLLARS